MPCLQVDLPQVGFLDGSNPYKDSGPYATEAECLQACKEGACCEGATCSVKPQCQCQGTGKTFKGVGTTCEDLKGACCDGNTCVEASECGCLASEGKTFRGRGTKCDPNPCPCYCEDGTTYIPDRLVFTFSGGQGYANCLDNEEYVGLYDFLYPQIQGAYIFKRTSCNPYYVNGVKYYAPIWTWGGAAIDGSVDTGTISPGPIASGGGYTVGFSKTVTAPLGAKKWVWGNSIALAAGGLRAFVNAMCNGGGYGPGGGVMCANVNPPRQVGSGVDVSAEGLVDLSAVNPFSRGFYLMDYSLSAG